MAKNQCTKDRTVKNVHRYLGAFSMECRYAIHQFLSWFDVDHKMEATVWSLLKSSELERARQAEELTDPDRRRDRRRGKFYVVEPRPLEIVVGICPKCNGKLLGEPQPSCETRVSGRVFYKECSTCTYYVETIKKDNKYIELEGG